jgi:hypothetical protein
MKYTIEQLGFILYNNRSVEGVVQNFLDLTINPFRLIQIEKKFDWCKSLYSNLEKMVEVDLSLLNPDSDDEIVTPEQLESISELTLSNLGKFSNLEKDFLIKRKITDSIIDKYQILGLSQFTDKEHLRVIGATCHPILQSFLKDGIDEGGIVFPLFKDGKLINCSIRRITDVGKLKYTLAVPDTPVWGLDDIDEDSELWICEGLFDMIALREQGIKAVSPSSAMWSGIQLYQLLEKKPSKIVIFCDNDRVGLKTGLVLNKFFNLFQIPSVTIHSKNCKDAAEHFFENNYSFDDLETIRITREMIEEKNDNSFDFLKYLQKRKF